MENYVQGVSPINEHFSMDNNQTLVYNRDIVWKVNLDTGETVLVARCYCSIVTNKSIMLNIELVRPDVYNRYASDLQATIDSWVSDAKDIAIKHNVPFLSI